MHTFYWHDYETWGANPAVDRPAQFAGIRTDADFNIIGEPLVLYCKPPLDLLPQPEACLITGITPQLAAERGVTEAAFIAAIHAELAQPGTCTVGYNSLRFDDEVTRYTLWRNFYDPYAREWQNRCSRWDIIDLVRSCRTLRPEGIEWPNHEDGSPSFKLEHLTAANGLSHESAHDALSDVLATIAVARLVREKQPRLFDYYLRMRNKRDVATLLDPAAGKPVLHISGRFPAATGCGTLVLPLARHPGNSNGVICFDLRSDPSPLLELDAEAIRARQFVSNAELQAQGLERIPLKTIHVNRCPMVATARLVDGTVAERLALDLAACERHAALLAGVDLQAKLAAVFTAGEARRAEPADAEQQLYGGFVSDADRALLPDVRTALPEQLDPDHFPFRDERLAELLWRYRARNFPESLSVEQRAAWRSYCRERLLTPVASGALSYSAYCATLQQLRDQHAHNAGRLALLDELASWGDRLISEAAANS